MKIVQRSCDTGVLSDPDLFHPEDRSLKLILSFVNEAQKKAKNLSSIFEATIKTEFDGVMRYFGEDPIDKSARAAFFRRFADFMTQYQNIKKENLQREETKRKEEARKKMLGQSQKPTGGRDEKTREANNKIMDDLLDKLRAAPRESGRHQRRRAARRNASGAPKLSILRSVSNNSEQEETNEAAPKEVSTFPDPITSPITAEADEELDLGKVAQGLLAGLKGGDDLLASFREATKAVNAGMNSEDVKPDERKQSHEAVEQGSTAE